jgi:tyrosyl-tRNA synthetase
MKTVLEILEERGFIKECTNLKVLKARLLENKITVYAGFDPTANSLHLGHLVPVIALSHMQRAGHRVLLIVGGATGMVGDPSGRSEERKLLTPEEVAKNIEGVKKQFSAFLDFSGSNAALILDNNEWISKMSFIDWLRDIGKHFTVNYMISKDSVKSRISFLLTVEDILNWESLQNKIFNNADGTDPELLKELYKFLQDRFSYLNDLEEIKGNDEKIKRYRQRIVNLLNDVIKNRGFFESKYFNTSMFTSNDKKLLKDNLYDLSERDVQKLNRLMIETLFPDEIAKSSNREEGLSFTEFSYMTMQAYDFLYLYDNYNCTLQCGGSDQLGNITAGTDLVRKLRQEKISGLAVPLATTINGEKFGKSVGNAIWLDSDRTSPWDFYQYLVRQDDRDAIRFLKIYTFLTIEKINEMEHTMRAEPEQRKAQKKLAFEVTRIVHGEDIAQEMVRAAEVVYGTEIKNLSDETLSSVFAGVPSSELKYTELEAGIELIGLFVKAGMTKSRSEIMRLLKSGGIYVNNVRVGDNINIGREHLASESFIILRTGKKNYHLVRVK